MAQLDPTKRAEYNRQYRKNHREKLLEYAREYRRKNKDVLNAQQRNLYAKNYEKHLQRDREKLGHLRLEIISLMGGKCVRCGFDDWRALQIDHINGDGGVERATGSFRYHIYKILTNNGDGWKQKYQLLCANCNWIKRYENGEVSRGRVISNGNC